MPSKIAWLFPGQGSQSVGMGKALAASFPDAARTYDDANNALGFDVRERGGKLAVTPPSFRATKDISIEADLIEKMNPVWEDLYLSF